MLAGLEEEEEEEEDGGRDRYHSATEVAHPLGRRGTRYDSRVEVVDSTLLYITDSPDVWGSRRLQIPWRSV